MKKVLVASLLLFFLLFCENADAQKLKDWVNTKKLEAKAKADVKINQKTSEGIDKVVNAPENLIKKKKEKKKLKKEEEDKEANRDTESNAASSSETISSASSNELTGSKPNENGEYILKTNIKCAAGKTHIEALLRELDGVNSITINAVSGKLYLSAGSNNTVYNIAIETINANGFEADGKKPANTKNKTCK